jgi:hypothetical protein
MKRDISFNSRPWQNKKPKFTGWRWAPGVADPLNKWRPVIPKEEPIRLTMPTDKIPQMNHHDLHDYIRNTYYPELPVAPDRVNQIYDRLYRMDESMHQRDKKNVLPDPRRSMKAAYDIYARERTPIPKDYKARQRLADEVINNEITAGRATEDLIEIFVFLYQYAEKEYRTDKSIIPNPYDIMYNARYVYENQ